jgi:SAM-dependent MidA family methyltransferase
MQNDIYLGKTKEKIVEKSFTIAEFPMPVTMLNVALYSGKFELTPDWEDILSRHLTPAGTLSYESFTREALYHETLGYYKRATQRVGKSGPTDFYTASHHEVFPELIADAVGNLLKQTSWECEHFCELAAEPGQNIWENTALPTDSLKIFRLGDSLEIPDSSVVYSNELFDAQPFQRWLSDAETWKPIHLKLAHGTLSECLYSGTLSEAEEMVRDTLPQAPKMDYHIDVSPDATGLMDTLARQNWRGLLIAIDYGMSWQQLISETPQGTARAYRNHQQQDSLFAHPGDQDLTTHVCWDFLEKSLETHGFRDLRCQTLSRFLLTHAQQAMERIVANSNTLTDKRKSQLLELVSPAFFGQKFQVLTALRA